MNTIENVVDGIIVHYGKKPSFARCDKEVRLPNGKVFASLCVLKKGHVCECAMGMYQCSQSPCKNCHIHDMKE